MDPYEWIEEDDLEGDILEDSDEEIPVDSDEGELHEFLDDGEQDVDVSDDDEWFEESDGEDEEEGAMFDRISIQNRREVFARCIAADTAVQSVTAGDPREHHVYKGNRQYQPVDFANCAVARITSNKCHTQTCDSLCAGPDFPGCARTVTVVDESDTIRSRLVGRMHSVSIEDLQGCNLAPPDSEDGAPHNSMCLQLNEFRIFGRPVKVVFCYSTRWTLDGSHLCTITAHQHARVQFWMNPEFQAKQPHGASTSPLEGLKPCGGILVPDIANFPQGSYVLRPVLHSLRCSHMLNCLRFGIIAGVQRAVVASQSGALYFFEVAAHPDNEKTPPASKFVCKSLRQSDAPPRWGRYTDLISHLLYSSLLQREQFTMPVILEDVLLREVPDLTEPAIAPAVLQRELPQSCVQETRSVGVFPMPLNGAEPSPDGRWICVLFDAVQGQPMQVLLLPEALDYMRGSGIALRWPDVDKPVEGNTQCEGCQYAAWSPDGQYLAVSSDSHASVAVWRIRLRAADALEPEPLGRALVAELQSAIHSDRHSAKALRASLEGMLPGHLWDELQRPAGSGGDLSGLPTPDTVCSASGAHRQQHSVTGGAASSHGKAAARQQQHEERAEIFRASQSGSLGVIERVVHAARNMKESSGDEGPHRKRLECLRALSKALWNQVDIQHIATFERHAEPCLALTFVPGMPDTLAWVEEKKRVHIANVLHPAAHHVVYLSTLPLQISQHRGLSEAKRWSPTSTPLSEENHWGFEEYGEGGTGSQDTVRVQLDPVPEPSVDAQGRLCTHAQSILAKMSDGRLSSNTAARPYPLAMTLALARGAALHVPKHLEGVADAFQEVYTQVLEDKATPTPELDAVTNILEWLEQCYPKNVITGLAGGGPNTLVVSTTDHIFKLALEPTWQPHLHWPQRFRQAAREMFLASTFGGGHAPSWAASEHKEPALWSLPQEVISHIVRASAGDRCSWLGGEEDGEGEDGRLPKLCGLSEQQCLSAEFLHAVVLPHVAAHGGLLVPATRRGAAAEEGSEDGQWVTARSLQDGL